MSSTEYAGLVGSPFVDERIAGDERIELVLVGDPGDAPAPGSLPIVVCYVGDELGGAGPEWADLVIGPDDIEATIASVGRAPLAATALAILLRTTPHLSVEEGLAAESAVYSMLQAGPEFARWRSETRARPEPSTAPTVITARIDDRLLITLDRPERHNAIDARLRDELAAALTVAIVDDSIRTIEMNGNGPSFSSGGDLHEFGQRPDPVTGHLTRLARSPARLVHRLRDRITVRVHGATLGGGLETVAFARSVTADPDTRFGLPEIGLGLIPGAGGTVSLPRRIGRQRTAALALTDRSVNASTALRWNLVDAIEPAPTSVAGRQ